MPSPLGDFAGASVKDEVVHKGNHFNQNDSLGKKNPVTVEL